LREEIKDRKVTADDAGTLFQHAEKVRSSMDLVFDSVECMARILEKYKEPTS
jgi:hypothetical protein